MNYPWIHIASAGLRGDSSDPERRIISPSDHVCVLIVPTTPGCWHLGIVDGTPVPAKDPGHETDPSTTVGWVKRHLSAIVIIGGAAFAVVGSGVGAALWISGQFAEVHRDINSNATDLRKEIADLRTAVSADAARTNEKLESLTARLNRLEGRMDTKFGADTDGDAGVPSDAGATWSAAHVARRDKLCADQCKKDLACLDRCTASVNRCGIKCPSTWASPCFTACVAGLASDAGP